MGAFWAGEKSRKIVSRIVVEGKLILKTPACFGNGDTDEIVDMPLLVDPLDSRTPLLTGASIAGALRNYLREYELGYNSSEKEHIEGAESSPASVLLFGTCREVEGEQSLLVFEDALGKNFGVEIRFGVALDPESRTAREGKFFNFQLWPAGTTFPLRLELAIREGDDEDLLRKALATALEGFNNGSITLGARKRRGYGLVFVPEWRVKIFKMTDIDGLLDWIGNGDEPLADAGQVQDTKTALGVDALLPDKRSFFQINASFALRGSLLIDSGGLHDYQCPDKTHVCAKQAGGDKPVLPGTSLAGALRARARRIAAVIGGRERAKRLINDMFGLEMDSRGTESQNDPKASRVLVSEAVIENARSNLVQYRVSIDRFTGGARETALFNEQPVFGGDDTILTVDIKLIKPQKQEIGLLLLLLKDLWTGDLPLGGGTGIGRGRLKGLKAVLTSRQANGSPQEWIIERSAQGFKIDGERRVLEGFVNSLSAFLKGACS